MSYKTLLKTKGITPDKVEKYHLQRKAQIAKATRDYYQSLSYKQADKIREKMETKAKKKVAQKLKLEDKAYKLAIKCIKDGTLPEPVRKQPTLKDYKAEAFRLVQLLARLLRSDNKWMLRLVDTGKLVHYKKAQWWHFFSKKNHPNLAFEIMNIRPISAISNKLQWDQPWYYWKENLLAIIGEGNYTILEAMSKEPKGEIRKKDYYIAKIAELQPLVAKELERIGEKR